MMKTWLRLLGVLVLVGLVATTFSGCRLLDDDDDTVPVVAVDSTMVVFTHMKVKEAKMALDGATGEPLVYSRWLKDFIKKTRLEEGCLGYDLYGGTGTNAAGTASATDFVLREVWRDGAAVGFHMAQTHFSAFMASASEFLDRRPDQAGGYFDVTVMWSSPADRTLRPDMVMGLTFLAAKTGMAAAAKSELTTLLNATRQEKGNLSFDVFQGLEPSTSANIFQVFDRYATAQDYTDHTFQTHTQAFQTNQANVFDTVWTVPLKMISAPVANIVSLPVVAGTLVARPQVDLTFYSAALSKVH